MKKLVLVIFDKEAGKIYAHAVAISEVAQEYFTQEEIVRIIGHGNSVIAFPADQYNGTIHESCTFDVKPMGDYVATMITKEDINND